MFFQLPPELLHRVLLAAGDLATAIKIESVKLQLPQRYPTDHLRAFKNNSLSEFPSSSRIFRSLSLQDFPEESSILLFQGADASESPSSILAWLARFHPEVFEFKNCTIPRCLANAGSLRGMRLLKASGILNGISANILEDAALSAKINILEYVERNGPFVFSPEVLNAAAKSGCLQTLAFVLARIKSVFRLWEPFALNHPHIFEERYIMLRAFQAALSTMQLTSARFLLADIRRSPSISSSEFTSQPYWSLDDISTNVNIAMFHLEDMGMPKSEIALTAPCNSFEAVVQYFLLTPIDTESQQVWAKVMSKAIDFGHLHIVNLLINNKIKVTWTCVIDALKVGRLDIFMTLLRHSKKEELSERLSSKAALIAAAAGGSIPLTQFLLYLGATFDYSHAAKAAHSGHLPLVKFLLANLPDSEREFPKLSIMLIKACRKGSMETIKYFCEDLQVPVNLNCMNLAAGIGHLDVIEYLHKRSSGAFKGSVEIWDEACVSEKLDIMKFLHREGYIITRDPEFYVDIRSSEVVKFLYYTAGINIENQVVEYSGVDGDIQHLQAYHDQTMTPPIDLMSPESWQADRKKDLTSALEIAIVNEQFDAVVFLCEKGYGDAQTLISSGVSMSSSLSIRMLRYLHSLDGGKSVKIDVEEHVVSYMSLDCLKYIAEHDLGHWTADGLIFLATAGCWREIEILKHQVLGLPKENLENLVGRLYLSIKKDHVDRILR
ncbi:hypothetical protein HDU97_008803 [Phlyctochytrium planicorne]|nr:hypothetical protein HDU97_008803 [Phlyctochytrium planicorne]